MVEEKNTFINQPLSLFFKNLREQGKKIFLTTLNNLMKDDNLENNHGFTFVFDDRDITLNPKMIAFCAYMILTKITDSKNLTRENYEQKIYDNNDNIYKKILNSSGIDKKLKDFFNNISNINEIKYDLYKYLYFLLTRMKSVYEM